jgi:hypothetical protein
MQMQNVSDEILKRYFPGLAWKIHGEGEASANIPRRENERFIDPSISVYRHRDGEYSASLYLADDLQVANWIDCVTLEGALESLRDRMLGISIALQTAIDPN